MKTPPLNLEELFRSQITELHATEKKLIKGFESLYASSQTDELKSASSPERSEQLTHVSRLAMILQSLKLKASRASDTVSEALLQQLPEVTGYKKQKDVFKDIQILHCLKTIYSIKIARYSSLQLIAENIDKKPMTTLLAQSLEDSRNNFAYLIQIEQNIIYPAAAK
jgi:ferritin-like metal-binding protein YciE